MLGTEPLLGSKTDDNEQVIIRLGQGSPQTSSSASSELKLTPMTNYATISEVGISNSTGKSLEQESYEIFSRSIEKASNVSMDQRELERHIKRCFALNALYYRIASFFSAGLVLILIGLIIADISSTDTEIWHRQVSVYYFVGSLFTLVSGCYVISSYWSLGALNRYPAPLYIWQTVCDIGLIIPVVINAIEDRLDDDNEFKRGFLSCKITAIFTQMCLFGSTAWFAVLTIDFYLSTKNPFSNNKLYLNRYHMLVWTLTALSGVFVALAEDNKPCHLCICWIKSGDGNAINFNMWGAYYSWQVISFLGAFIVLYYCIRKLNFDFKQTILSKNILVVDGKNVDDIRIHVVQQNAFHVLSLALYFLAVAILYRIYDTQRRDPPANDDHGDSYFCSVENQSNLPILKALAVLMSGKGVLNAVIWYRKNYEAFAKEEAVVKDSLSQILRNDVIRATITGIAETALMASGPKIENQYNRYNYNCLLELSLEGKTTGEKIIIKSYAMLAFRLMRDNKGIHPHSYVESLVGKPGEQNTTELAVKESFSEGRSGSFLYFSKDGRFVVKTVSESEAKFLLDILPNFHRHMVEDSNTLINHLYGLHSIDIYGIRMYFVVMENVIQIPLSRQKDSCYDLKGSIVDRYVEGGELDLRKRSTLSNAISKIDNLLTYVGLLGAADSSSDIGQSKSSQGSSSKPGRKILTLKDENFVNDLKQLFISREIREQLLKQIHSDVNFFNNNGIMDYSLLLVISIPRKESIPRPRSPSTFAPHNSTPTAPNFSISEIDSQENIPFFRRYEGGIQDLTALVKQVSSSIRSMDRVIHIGIVDILQEYNLNKKSERFAKTYIYRKDSRGISCVPPPFYAMRFEEFMEEIFLGADSVPTIRPPTRS